ncbi:MAG: nucleotidyltransferase family protein [Candidatus Bathyarchaeota archaeon]|nr:nucleotidyltransferase family protein [Candidatus Bathyarchaeota archaeon]
MDALRVMKKLGLKKWCIGAGVIRNIVWSKLHGLNEIIHRDIDVAIFDECGTLEYEKEIERKLMREKPYLLWEVKNQALVHLWYERKFGFAVEPITSIEDAVSTWPETATCVGVYLDDKNEIRIISPYGLEDLFKIILRRNPTRITREIFEKRIEQKNMIEKWPKMTIMRD